MSTYHFWGIDGTGKRDLIGMCEATDMGDAFTKWPSVLAKEFLTMSNFVKVEIMLTDTIHDALSKLPKLRGKV